MDGGGVEGVGEGEPEGEFLGQEVRVLGAGEEAFVEREGLEADYGEVEGITELADSAGSREEVVP